jgi:hypothetical protein
MLFCYSILFFNLSCIVFRLLQFWDIVVVVVTFGGHRSLVQVVMLLILRELLIKELYSFIPLAVKRFYFLKKEAS